MSDYLSGFDDWTAAFVDWTDVSISELHGLLSALMCAIKPMSEDEWRQLLAELSFSIPSDKALELLAECSEDVSFALKDKDDAYEFTPIIPDDEHDLYERFVALKNWASGFITGIGVADIHLKEDELEMLSDLAKIAALRPDDMSELFLEAEETGEQSLDEAFEDDGYDEAAENDTHESGESMYFGLYEFARMVPVAFAVRQKKPFKELALVKGLDPSRKTAKETALPPIMDAMHKH